MNKLKESLLNNAKKVLKILAMQAMKLPTPPPLPLVLLQDLVILIFMLLAILAIGVCVFSAYNYKSSETVNKEKINEEQQQPVKPPKRCNML